MQAVRACSVWAHCHGITRRFQLVCVAWKVDGTYGFYVQAIATLTDSLYIYLFNNSPL